jgi:type IV pilus assembly protein PilQ
MKIRANKYMIIAKRISLFILLLILGNVSLGQTQCEKIQNAKTQIPQLSDSISISVSNAPFREFVRGIAFNEGLNLSVSPEISFSVSNNFSDVVIADVLCFLANEYPIQIEILGNIIKITPKDAPIKPEPLPKTTIKFTADNSYLTIDSKRDSLQFVCRAITKSTPFNVIHDKDLGNTYVNGYIDALPIKEALEAFGQMNGLLLNEIKDSVFIFQLPEPKTNQNRRTTTSSNNRNHRSPSNSQTNQQEDSINFYLNLDNTFSLSCLNTELETLVRFVSDTLNKQYFISGELEGTISLKLENITYDNFIKTVFQGTNATFREENGILLFGPKDLYEIKEARVINLRFRSVDKLAEVIPGELKNNIEIKEFLDLNSLLVFGSQTHVAQLERFIREIDQLVPVVMIEVIIVDISSKKSLAYGVEAGMSANEIQTGGTVFPALNYTLNAQTINTLLNSFSGFGGVKLGNVASDFYLNLKFLEENGIIKIRSTPKLSTLNGTEASLSIGNTEYYLEVQSNLVVNQSTQNVTTQQYKPIQADLSINIKPIVSGDEQITLDIEVNHSSFTGRMNPNAPPGTTSRSFKSMIRVKNNEMILLGGLEEKSVNDTHKGVPFLSKIPVIKWFFSNSTKDKSKSKLNVFIKPTIIY